LHYRYKNGIGLITEGTSTELKKSIQIPEGKKIDCLDLDTISNTEVN